MEQNKDMKNRGDIENISGLNDTHNAGKNVNMLKWLFENKIAGKYSSTPEYQKIMDIIRKRGIREKCEIEERENLTKRRKKREIEERENLTKLREYLETNESYLFDRRFDRQKSMDAFKTEKEALDFKNVVAKFRAKVDTVNESFDTLKASDEKKVEWRKTIDACVEQIRAWEQMSESWGQKFNEKNGKLEAWDKEFGKWRTDLTKAKQDSTEIGVAGLKRLQKMKTKFEPLKKRFKKLFGDFVAMNAHVFSVRWQLDEERQALQSAQGQLDSVGG